MQFKSVVLCVFSAAAFVLAAALPTTNVKARSDINDSNLAIRQNPVPIDVRGDVPDLTNLKLDIIPDAGVPRPGTLATTQSFHIAATDRLLFEVSIKEFLDAKSRRDPSELIWDDDGCSSSPDKPLGFNFLPSCQRHDFGYRNYKNQGRFTEENRKKIDDNFKKDMYDECDKQNFIKKPICKGLAITYYNAVRAFGNL
ncbi:prokaryotic phospholipase A2-domain-containing protein [Kalaharituber pfeilii]|nr:prokaryotic phospholipase A2-domain-containing protein [Kalaharituber pfeilii]